MTTAPTPYRVRINLIPAPRGHDFGAALEVLAAIGRRHPGAAAAMAEGGKTESTPIAAEVRS